MTQPVPSPTLPSVENYSLPSNSLAGSQEFRLDAAHYNPELLKAISVLRTSGMRVERLADITDKLFIPPRFKRIYVDNPAHGVPFLQGRHIVQFQPTDIKHLSKSCHRLERWMVSAEWLLVTCSGTIGRTVMCPQEWDGWAASQHILRIVPDKKKCPPGYLCAFLASPCFTVRPSPIDRQYLRCCRGRIDRRTGERHSRPPSRNSRGQGACPFLGCHHARIRRQAFGGRILG